MTTKNNAPGQNDTGANKQAAEDHNPKTRIVMLCPCCDGEVTHQRYAFDVLSASPFLIRKWFVCDACTAALSGDDPKAREATENAFLAHLEASEDAPAT